MVKHDMFYVTCSQVAPDAFVETNQASQEQIVLTRLKIP